MKLLLFIVVSLSLFAGEADKRIYYVNMMPEAQEDQLKIHFEPMLFSQEGKSVNDVFLSEVVQATVTHLRVHEKRADSRALDVFRLPLHLELRDLKGNVIHHIKKNITFGTGKPGHLRIVSGKERLSIPYSKMDTPHFYPKVLKTMLAALHEETIPPITGIGAFAMELYHTWPKELSVFVGKGYRFKQDHFANPDKLQLGVAYCRQVEGGYQATNLVQLQEFEASTQLLKQARNYGSQRQMDLAKQTLQTYFERVPSSSQVAQVLAELYLAEDIQKATRFIADYQPYFARFFNLNSAKVINSANPLDKNFTYSQNSQVLKKKRRAENMKAAQQAKAAYKRLLGKMRRSKEDPGHRIWITTPVPDDIVAGETFVEAVAWSARPQVSMLRAQCLVNGEVMDEISNLPLQFRVKVPNEGKHQLSVRIYFDDQTYGSTQIPVSSLPVTEQTRVPRNRLQVVGLDSKGQPLTLDQENIQILEDKQPFQASAVSQDRQPLDLVLLIDTSTTMGYELPKVQAAVYSFLSEMKPDESVSIYTFDQKVALLHRFQGDGDLHHAAARLFTLSAFGQTAINDAVLVARSQLMADLKATKGIIIIGDGADTSSTTSNLAVAGMLKGTPIRVYSVDINAGAKSLTLDRLANATGGTYTHVTSATSIGNRLKGVLHELRSLYFVNYQGISQNPANVQVQHQGKTLRSVRVTL